MSSSIDESIILVPKLIFEFTTESRNELDSIVVSTGCADSLDSQVSSISSDSLPVNDNDKITTQSASVVCSETTMKPILKSRRCVNYEIKLKKHKKQNKKNYLIEKCSIM